MDEPSTIFKFTYGNKIEMRKDENKNKTGFTENKKRVNLEGITVGIQKDKMETSIYKIKKHDFTY